METAVINGIRKRIPGFHTCSHGRVPANMYDENYALLRATGALASLQPFGFRSFCAKSVRKTASSSCLRTQQTASGLRQMCASVSASTRLRPLGSLFIHTLPVLLQPSAFPEALCYRRQVSGMCPYCRSTFRTG